MDDLQQQKSQIDEDARKAKEVIDQDAAEARQLYRHNQMTLAGIGRGAALQHNPAIRQDFIYWLTGDSIVQQRYHGVMDKLRQTLNCSLMLGLFEFEAHYAVYEAGAFYKRHYDSFSGNANRIVSVVTYLNDKWSETDGGELLIYAPDQQKIIQRIIPNAGTLIVFLSEKIPHEVAVTYQQRMSITGWFRLTNL